MKETDYGITLSEASVLDKEHLRLTYLFVVGVIVFAVVMLGAALDWFSAVFVLPVVGALIAITVEKTSVETRIARFIAQNKKGQKNCGHKV